MPPKHKSNNLASELTSELAYTAPFSGSVAHEAGEPVKKVLEMAEEGKEECLIASGQTNHHYLAAVISENPVETDDQAISPLFTKPSSQFSGEILKDVETGKQVHIKSQDLTVLLKKADEIVDAVLLLAIEEIRSKQAAGVCQTNDFKDCLLGPSLQKDQKTQEMLLKSKEIRLRNLSLKHFNENSIETLSGVKGEGTVSTDIQDETIPFDTNDKIDLHSSIVQQAKEIVDDVLIRAKQKLTYNQSEHHVGMDLFQNTGFRSQTDALERLSTASELTVKPPKIIEHPLNLSPELPAVVHTIISEHEVANSSALFYINPKNDSKGITTGEMAPSNLVPASKEGDEWFDSATRLESNPAERGKGKSICDTHVMDVSDKASNWTGDSESEHSLYVVNGEAVVIEEQLPSCSSVPGNMLPFNSNVNSYTCLCSKAKDDYGLLDLVGSNEETELPKYICKESKTAAFVPEELHEKYDETDNERGGGKVEKACTVLQDKNSFSSQFHISESSVMRSSAKIGLNSDFTCEEAAIIGPGLTMATVLKEGGDNDDDDDGRRKSSQCFASSSEEEWEGNSSFTILYEGTLQNESIPSLTEDSEHPLSSLPDLSLDNIKHLLMSETAKGKLQSVQPFEEINQFNSKFDNALSESFMTVEAKRFKVYPFSLSPIYEDDSSQEDLLSADISPRCPSEKSRDCGNQSLSVLSLLQSVSERLKSSEHCSEEELGEENQLEDEKGRHISSHWSHNLSVAISENIHEKTLLSRHSPLFPKTAFSTDEALSFNTLHLQKSYPSTKTFSRSLYYECLQSSRRYSGEKGTRFGSTLLPEDQQSEDEGLQKLGTSGMCPVDREELKCNPRPGKVVICDVRGNRNKREIYHDVLDATEWVFSNRVLIKVVRGWILYEEPEFKGQKYVLEDGEEVTNDIWNPNCERHPGHFTIGSIRQVIKNCCVPEVVLYSQIYTDHFPICIQSAVANLEELEVMNPTLSVTAGVWLAYSDVNYKGEVMILEENHNPCEISAADVKSLHPLKMGGLKVQMPMNIKIIIYERPQFGGRCKELSENIDCVPTLFRNADVFQGIGSIRVIGGIWVGYEKERYKGKQYLLEEGEYEDWQSWGGVNSVLLSFRFLQADFMKSEITLFEMDEENGKFLNIVNQEIPDLEQAGFGLVTRSVTVKSGVWVAYQQKYFCGDKYILEKGKYKCFFDWGGSSETIMSIRPIKLEPLGNHEPTHWLKAFSNTHFQGLCMDFTTEVTDFASFTPCSFKVLRGCWLLHYQGETTDDQCVLEEDLYNDLASCGCPVAAIKSLKPVEYVFAEPFISLFTLENCEGRELNVQEAYSSVLNKDLHFLTRSLWVRSGLWIAYEGSNFLGKQFLLEPSKISNWTQFSGWKAIGSLRPVKQPAAYFRIKNRSQDKYLTVAGNLMDARATSVCLSPLNGKDTQIWCYSCGLIKSKVNDACLDVIGGRDAPGAKVALWVEHGKARQKWTFNKDGTISSYLSDQLVLDIKGGYYYDRNHVIINQFHTGECTQRWDFEIL
ncbi:very large A-kinase anchor protein isoform X2 [Tiliqua scincoides]|uniref:very large A-kinase anchor protein isoform X2 n=1 Tax=Tiliqua scincoides TaxID=71010 RepID=UPI0034618085